MIEIMIVMVIIGLIVTMGGAAYTNAVRQGRDARRKVDLDQIRSALELYRSNDANAAYPTSTTSGGLPPHLDQAQVASYLKVPIDPGHRRNYYYTSVQSDGSPCGFINTYCRDYTLATYLETARTPTACTGVPSMSCYRSGGTTVNCNYCVGPLGER